MASAVREKLSTYSHDRLVDKLIAALTDCKTMRTQLATTEKSLSQAETTINELNELKVHNNIAIDALSREKEVLEQQREKLQIKFREYIHERRQMEKALHDNAPEQYQHLISDLQQENKRLKLSLKRASEDRRNMQSNVVHAEESTHDDGGGSNGDAEYGGLQGIEMAGDLFKSVTASAAGIDLNTVANGLSSWWGATSANPTTQGPALASSVMGGSSSSSSVIPQHAEIAGPVHSVVAAPQTAQTPGPKFAPQVASAAQPQHQKQQATQFKTPQPTSHKTTQQPNVSTILHFDESSDFESFPESSTQEDHNASGYDQHLDPSHRRLSRDFSTLFDEVLSPLATPQKPPHDTSSNKTNHNIVEYEQQLVSLRSQLHTSQEQLNTSQEQLKTTQERLKSTEQELVDAQTRYKRVIESNNDQHDAAQQENQALEIKCQQFQRHSDALQQSVVNLQHQIDEQQITITSQQSRVEKLSTELTIAENKIQTTQSSLDEMTTQYEKLLLSSSQHDNVHSDGDIETLKNQLELSKQQHAVHIEELRHEYSGEMARLQSALQQFQQEMAHISSNLQDDDDDCASSIQSIAVTTTSLPPTTSAPLSPELQNQDIVKPVPSSPHDDSDSESQYVEAISVHSDQADQRALHINVFCNDMIERLHQEKTRFVALATISQQLRNQLNDIRQLYEQPDVKIDVCSIIATIRQELEQKRKQQIVETQPPPPNEDIFEGDEDQEQQPSASSAYQQQQQQDQSQHYESIIAEKDHQLLELNQKLQENDETIHSQQQSIEIKQLEIQQHKELILEYQETIKNNDVLLDNLKTNIEESKSKQDNENHQYTKALSESEAHLAEYNSKMQEQEHTIKQLQCDVDEYKRLYESLQDDMLTSQSNASQSAMELLNAQETLNALEAELSLVQSQFAEAQIRIEQLQTELQQEKESTVRYEDRTEKFKTAIKALKLELKTVQAKHDELETTHQTLENEYEEIMGELTNVQVEKNQLEQRLKASQEDQEIVQKQYQDECNDKRSLHDTYTDLIQQYEQMEKSMTALQLDKEQVDVTYIGLERQYNDLQDELQQRQDVIHTLENELSFYRQEITTLATSKDETTQQMTHYNDEIIRLQQMLQDQEKQFAQTFENSQQRESDVNKSLHEEIDAMRQKNVALSKEIDSLHQRIEKLPSAADFAHLRSSIVRYATSHGQDHDILWPVISSILHMENDRELQDKVKADRAIYWKEHSGPVQNTWNSWLSAGTNFMMTAMNNTSQNIQQSHDQALQEYADQQHQDRFTNNVRR